MVILVHACEFYYLGDGGIEFAMPSDRMWVAWIDGALRESVPLFVMASSYLLVPLTMPAGQFLRRRFVRVFVPFAIWSVLYAVVPVLAGTVEGSVADRLVRLLYSFNDDSGHLWFIYMLIGVYLVMPVISPWLRQASRREELTFLAVWGVSTLWGYLQPWLGDIWGKALWNDFHALYYYSGFIGYVVLAHYIREHVRWSLRKSALVAVPLIAVGYAVTAGLFYVHTGESADYAYGEQSWCFCTVNVAMMALGCFLLLRHVRFTGAWLYRPVQSVSRLSYGIYLMHIFVLGVAYALLSPHLSTPAAIFSVGTVTFFVCWGIARVLSMIPVAGKWLIG